MTMDRTRRARLPQQAFALSSPLLLRRDHLYSSLISRPKSKVSITRTKSIPPRIVCASSGVVDPDFSQWAASVGISMPSLTLTDFATNIRGLSANAPINKRATLISVPSKSVLQVTSSASEKPPPDFPIPRPQWRTLPWYARLALLLISAQRNQSHLLHPWTNRLPKNVDVPHRWSDSELSQLQSARFKALIIQQRRTYDDCFRRLSQLLPRDTVLSKSEFFSAIDRVRSRAFSGPLETAPFQDRARLTIFIAVNTFLWPLVHVLSWQNSLNGGLTAMFSLAVFDIILPRVQRIIGGNEPRRYAIVPGVDMFNHNGVEAKDAQVEFRYFTDSFNVLSASNYSVNDEVHISYGKQSNDAFVQYYGFVEHDNPVDDFVFDDNVTEQLSIPKGRLVAQKNGFDGVLVARVQKRLGGSRDKAIKLLREMCRTQLELFDTTIEEDTALLKTSEVLGSARLTIAIRYRRAKKQLLQSVLDNWETGL